MGRGGHSYFNLRSDTDGKLKGGRTVDTPIISFDILPTSLDALGVMPAENDFARNGEPRRKLRQRPESEYLQDLVALRSQVVNLFD